VAGTVALIVKTADFANRHNQAASPPRCRWAALEPICAAGIAQTSSSSVRMDPPIIAHGNQGDLIW